MSESNPQFDQEDINNNKLMACLSYVGIFFLIPMFLRKDSAYVKFHVNQGVVVFILTIATLVLSTIISIIGIPLVGTILPLIPLALMIFGLVNCFNGKAVGLPVIGNIQIIK